MKSDDIIIPADVPSAKRAQFAKNMQTICKFTKNIAIFSGDQKIEHLNDDFYGKSDIGQIPIEHSNPDHLFKLARSCQLGAFSTHYGTITRYGPAYPTLPYIVKANGKSNLVHTKQKDPISLQHVPTEQIIALQSKFNIVGVGYTIYLGSEFESDMLSEAGELIADAHAAGIPAMIWMYPRGKAVSNETDVHLVAGGAGVATSLGADIVKVNYGSSGNRFAESFKEVVAAAGNTKVICSGGESKNVKTFLQILNEQINIAGCAGCAVGRNLHQRDLKEAMKLSNAISAIVYQGKNSQEAFSIYNNS